MENNSTITQKIIDGLQKAIIELEEFQVQATLGKAEAHDLYEDIKKKFDKYVHSAKEHINTSKTKIDEETEKLEALLGKIRVQLALGKAETKDLFEEQKENLHQLFVDLEKTIRSNKTLNSVYSGLLHEVEIFKLKLEILKFKYDLKKAVAKTEFEENKQLIIEKIRSLGDHLKNDKSKESEKFDNFKKEIAEAYSHLKKAFVGH